MPRVSICMSVRNQSEWFKESLKSVIDQTYKDWEMILVDDGSTEDIKSIVESFNDPRIHLTRWDENKGIPHGVNWAFQQAKTEYVQPLAADEVLEPNKLEQQVKLLDEDKSIQAVCGLPQMGVYGLPMGERPMYELYSFKAQNRNRYQWLLTFLNCDYVPIGSCSALWRREVFDDLGYFRTDLLSFSDHEWWVRFLEKYKVKMFNFRWAQSRPNQDAVSSSKQENAIEIQKAELEKVRNLHPIKYEEKFKVTVGIPCKDMEKYIGETINSVIAQTHTDWEIIVVDDGSTDKSAEIVQAYKNPKIRLVSFVENRGQQEALNYALQAARGDYFIPLSADDTIEPVFMQKCLEIFNINAPLEFIASQTDFIKEDGTPYTEDHIFKQIQRASNRTRDQWKEQFRIGNVYFGAGMIRTDALRDIGGFRTSSGVLSDYDVYLRLIHRFDIYVIEENLTHTRITGKNQSNSCDPVWLKDKYRELQSEFYPQRRKLIIATPFYMSQGFSPYIKSMTQTIHLLTQAGVQHEFWELSGDAYVDRAKNTILNKFLEDKDNTDLFMIDSDMSWDPVAFLKVLTFPEGLVAGSYPMKNAWGKWTSTPWAEELKDQPGKVTTMGRNIPGSGPLLKGRELSGGFVRYRREFLEEYKSKYPEAPTYKDHGADPSKPDREYYNFFYCDVHEGMRWGEDRVLSRRLNEAKMDWWIFTDINFGHYGMTGYHGNFHSYLLGDKSGADSAKAS